MRFYLIICREQIALKKKLKLEDSKEVKQMLRSLERKDGKRFYVAGVDISFIKGNNVDACAALMVISLPDLQVRQRIH